MRIFIILMALGAIAYAPVYWAATPALRRHIGPRFVASFTILIFAGFFAPPTIFFLACVAAMAVFPRDKLDAACLFVLLGALIPSSPWSVVVSGLYLAQVSTLDVLGVGLMLATLIKRTSSISKRPVGWSIEDTLVLVLFLAFNVAATRLFFGVNGLMRQIGSGFLQFALPYILIRRNLKTVEDVRVVVGVIAIASAILSVYALYEAYNGWSLFAPIIERLGGVNAGLRNLAIRGGTLRASTSMLGALMLGCYLSVGWVAMICSRGMVRGKIQWIGGCVLIALGELAAQSRGSLACIALAGAILLATHRRPVIAAAAAAAAGCGAAILLFVARFSSKIAGFLNLDPTQQYEDVYDYRQVLFKRGMQEAAKHRWTGAPLDAVLERLQDIKQGEGIVDLVNTYLFFYLVTGLIGVFIIVAILILILNNLVRSFKKADDSGTVAIRSFAFTSLIVILAQLGFMSFIDRMPLLLTLTLVASRSFVLTQKRERRTKQRNLARSGNIRGPVPSVA